MEVGWFKKQRWQPKLSQDFLLVQSPSIVSLTALHATVFDDHSLIG